MTAPSLKPRIRVIPEASGAADAPKAPERRTSALSVSVPRHIAIVMDGNRRWAQRRGRPTTWGHRRGVAAVRRVVEHVAGLGASFLTLYGFSSENWKRPPDEVAYLMGLFRRYLSVELPRLHENRIRLRIVGARDGLPEDIVAMIDEAEALTSGYEAFNLAIAFNYGGRDELLRACRRLAGRVERGELDAEAVSIEDVENALDTRGMPDPDLIIRTGGERRISNFLLWQSAYAEFVFDDRFWPDFDAAAVDAALQRYRRRERRFGGDAPSKRERSVP